MGDKTYEKGILKGLQMAEKIFQTTKVLDEVYEQLIDYKEMIKIKIDKK